jgi:predicted DNA-binding transcriptional regulator YafY
VRFEYFSFARESIDQLNLDPLAIVKERGMWKTIAYCQEMDEIMLFRIDRIKTLKITDHSFEMPPNIRKISELRFAS